MPELISCPECQRNNAIRRTACIYCGAALPVTDASASVQVPTMRPVEEWERGFSVILAPLDSDAPTQRQVDRLCEIARLEEEAAVELFNARVSLPIARVPTRDDAELLARLLGEADLGSAIVSDDELAVDTIARRVRELRMREDEIDLHVLWGDWVTLARSDLVLAVGGRIVSTEVEIIEQAGKKRGNLELVDTSHFFNEAFAIDLYGPTLDRSFRIKADSFDFSCFGERPSHRLEVNVTALAERFRSYLGASRYDGDYDRVSRLLEHAWPPVSRVQSRGVGLKGDFRRYAVSSVSTDAPLQFTRYSRMRYVLALH